MVPAWVTETRSRALDVVSKLDFLGPLTARLTLGVVFVGTGWGKAHAIDKVTGFFTELGIPAPHCHAYLVAYTELFGGALLLLGLASRLAALPLAVSMLVAIATAQRDQVHGLADLFGLVEWTYVALLGWLMLAGPGRASLDRLLLARFTERRATARPAATHSAEAM